LALEHVRARPATIRSAKAEPIAFSIEISVSVTTPSVAAPLARLISMAGQPNPKYEASKR